MACSKKSDNKLAHLSKADRALCTVKTREFGVNIFSSLRLQTENERSFF